ncbi:DNA polymerase III, delta subunit [Ekhidna lutea]|uniref:DNA polymerase III subunit delta n=1 Tax=Ekhidna lutea TaxID=447679 RepID=A0A239GT53_EKHLU|nr:DNA polymerase III subunit delta [Ekhidna lutea]SNS72022.1 DNA polymerase III, delta subunit [Ekhidna lutea]
MASEYTEILKDINSGVFAPVYFLQGEETFFIDNIIEKIENNALEESQKSFNQVILYGKDTNLTDVIGAARRYPMMGERQVVIVKEAQEMRDWSKEDKQTLVLNYLENPLASTILVFGYKYKSVDKRTKFGKAIDKKSVFLNAKKLYDNQVPDWIKGYCKSKKINIQDSAVMMLSENIGNNLQRLANEIEKLLLNLKEGAEIDSAMIQRYVGISKDYNIFELQKALSAMNKLKAHKIADYFAANPSNNPLVLTIYSLFSYFSKLLLIHHSSDKNDRTIASLIGVNPFFVKEYLQAARNYPLGKVVQNIKYLHEADMQSKGIGYATKKEGPVLTELVYKLMN